MTRMAEQNDSSTLIASTDQKNNQTLKHSQKFMYWIYLFLHPLYR